MVSPHFSIFFWSWSKVLDCISQGKAEQKGKEEGARRGDGRERRKDRKSNKHIDSDTN